MTRSQSGAESWANAGDEANASSRATMTFTVRSWSAIWFWRTSVTARAGRDSLLPELCRCKALEVLLQRQFAGRVGGAHVADLAEDLALGPPGAIVTAQDPKDAGVGIGVATVDGVLVVERDHGFQRVLGRGGPLQNFLAPQHAQIVVHAAVFAQLILGGVPQPVVGGAGGELVQRIDPLAAVAGVFGQRGLGPGGQRFVAVVVGAVGGEVVADLAPGDELIEKGFGVIARVPPALAAAGGLGGQLVGRPAFAVHQAGKNFVRPDMAEVQVGRQSAGGVCVGIVALLDVIVEMFVEKACQRFAGRLRAPGERRGANGMVDGQLVQAAVGQQSLEIRWRPLPQRGRQEAAWPAEAFCRQVDRCWVRQANARAGFCAGSGERSGRW